MDRRIVGSGLIMFLALLISVLTDSIFSGSREIKPSKISKWFLYLPTLLIALLNMIGFSVTDFVELIYNHFHLFSVFAILLAVSILPIAVIERAFKINSKKAVYTFLSNTTGALCYLTLLYFLKSLPNFLVFLDESDWVDYAGLFGPLGMMVAFFQCLTYQRQLESKGLDNNCFTKMHILVNTIHLWFTITVIASFLLFYLFYAYKYFHHYDISYTFLLPIFAATAFFACSACSQTAIDENAINVSASIIGLIILSIVVVLALFSSSFSAITVIIGLMYIGIVSIWCKLINRVSEKINGSCRGTWIVVILIVFSSFVLSAVLIQIIFMV